MRDTSQNIYSRYGFIDNPYDIRALSKTSNLPIDKAYVKRNNYEDIGGILDFFFAIPGGGRIVIEGDSGVGKTTFINYHKSNWRDADIKDRLFSPETEISVKADWDIDKFIYNSLGSLVGQLRLDLGERRFKKQKILQEIQSFAGILFQTNPGLSANIGIPTLFSVGGSVSKGTSISIGKNLESQLQQYLDKTIEFILNYGYRGVILHFNNMELLQNKSTSELQRLFENIRDILQTRNIYYVFIGGRRLYQDVIMPIDRVRSIFYDEPVVVPALEVEKVVEIINRRYIILSAGREFVKPVADDVVEYLYNSFNGGIRDIMNTITNLLARIPEGVANTLHIDEVKPKLLSIEEQKLKRQDLSDIEIGIFKILLENGEFTNKKLVERISESKQYVNKYIISKFLREELIVMKEKRGRSTIYTVHPRFRLLIKLVGS